MDNKSLIRKKYFLKRKKKFFEISDKFFLPLINLIKKRGISKKAFISLYYPSSFEVDVLKILKVEYFKKFNFLLPIIQKNTGFDLKVTSSNPYIVSLSSAMWEGSYSPKYYRRA